MAQQRETTGNVAEPREYLLRIDRAIPMPLGLEYVVTVDVDGEKFEACVPAKIIVSEDPAVVSGWYTGTQGGHYVIVFPPSSLGTSIWRLSENVLAALTAEE